MKTTGVVSTSTASASAQLETETDSKNDDEIADGLPELVVDTEVGARAKSNGVGSTDSVDSGLAGDHSSPEHEHGYAYGRSNRRRPRGSLKMPPYPGFEWIPASQGPNDNAYYYNYDKLSPLGDMNMECDLDETNYGSHIIYVHVNLGETLSVRVGEEVQHIPGPATVRMVTSRNSAPPLPLPLHVPPGHIVQQILDEYGILRHLVLSPQTPPSNAGSIGPFQVVNMNNGYVSPNVQFMDANGTTTYYDGTYTYAVSPDPSNGELLLDGSTACMIDPNDTNGLSPPVYQTSQDFEPSVAQNARESYRRPFKQYQTTQPEMDDQTRMNGHAGIENQYRSVPPRIGGRRKRNGAYNSYRGGSGVLSDSNGRYPMNDRYSGKSGRMNNDRNRLSAKHDGPVRNYRSSYSNGYSSQPPAPAPFRPPPEPISGETSALSSSNPPSSHDDDEVIKMSEMLSRIPPPQVRDISSSAAFVQWQPFDCSEASANGGSFPQIDASEFTYEVLLYDDPDGKATQNHRCQAELYPQLWLTDLKPASDYFVRLRASLEERGVHGEPSPAVAFKTKAAQPEKPKLQVQQRSKTWLLVAWQRPLDNGSDISSYHLEIDGPTNKEKGFTEICSGLGEEYKVQNLQPAASYQIRLAASNSVGKSEFSEVIIAKTTGGAPTEPDAPSLVEATSDTLSLEWKRREYDDEFQLFMEDKDKGYHQIGSTRDVSYVVPNLVPSREYRFRLTASNEEGSSSMSQVATFRTLPPKPSPPSKLRTVGDISDAVTVTWNATNEKDGSINYVLEMLQAKSNIWSIIYEGAHQEFDVTKLEPGSSYRFRVSSRSEGGKSEYSDELALVTPTAPPGACDPPTLEGDREPTVLHLRWTAPEIIGGSDLIEYELSMGHPPKPMTEDTERVIYRGWNTDYIVSNGLQPGCTYLFRVRAHNAVGPGPWSQPFECQTSAAAPECPQRLRMVEMTSRSACLMWEPPGFNNGSPVTIYKLYQAYRKLSSVSASPTQTPVADKTRNQPIAESSISQEISMTFQKVTDLGHCSKTFKSFQRQISTASNASDMSDDCFSAEADTGAMIEIYAGPELSYEVKDLIPGTEYAFCAQAINEAGESRMSNALFCRTPADVPDVPAIAKAEPLSLTEIMVSWTAPADNGSPIVSYHLETLPVKRDDSGYGLTFPMALMPQTRQFTVQNLLPATKYRIRLQAVNDIGASEFSVSVEVTTLPPPPLPPRLDLVSATHNSLKLKWQCDSIMEDETVTLEMENKTGTFSPLATDMMARSYKVVRLNESTPYRFRIRASSAAGGIGSWSEIFVFTTLKAPPAPVKYAPKIGDITETSCEIEWLPVKLISSVATNDKVHYDLQIRSVCSSSNTSEGVFETVYKGPNTTYHLNGLTPGAAYKVRVSSVRVSETGGETESSPSPISTFSTVTPPSLSMAVEENSEGAFGTKVLTDGLNLLYGNDRQISDRQWAMLILVGFSLLALLVAFVLQRFIPEGPAADSHL